jgi:hypothetical protein
MVDFPEETRKEPAREGNKKGTIRRLGLGIGIGAGVIREEELERRGFKKNQNGFGIVFEGAP